MATTIPITLVGDNLGKRHKYLNSLVNEAYKNSEEFSEIKNLPEKSPIDRLFKIDFASKIKNVDYIIQNLKDDDMLYVSRALKATWLIEKKYEGTINPDYLEDSLYPEMITTAVNKMQHWIHLNLNDELRCKQFFEYYREKNFQLAMKFLLKCSKDYIKNECSQILYKITPHYLKVMTEKCPQVAKIFFDSIPIDDDVKRLYLTKETAYFDTLRHLLKSNPEIVFDITEQYFHKDVFNRFSAIQTKLIIKQHKNRFWAKPELYTAWLLNIQALADNLTVDEAKDLVLKLARAQYLNNQNWFNYKRIEPLIKRLKPEERPAFKKQVFVEKDIGETEEEWPYEIPKPPVNEMEFVTIFDDRQPEPYEYSHLNKKKYPKRAIKKKCGRKCDNIEIMECSMNAKTLLDKLFDEFRFASFAQTLYELRKRIAAESSPKNREFMLFVLISKTGGRPDALASLLELLERHCNEPVNVRAAIIRSLVKRAQVWRLPEMSWDQLMKFGQGLGLDGKTPEADCYEGLHAVVIRSLLQNIKCESDVKNMFLNNFSTLTDYCLNSAEKKSIAIELPKMLFQLAKENEENNDIYFAVKCIDKLIQTLDTYKIKIETYPGLIDTIADIADKENSYMEHLIRQLFNAKIARKQFFRFTFKFIMSDASYINALRHDTNVLDVKKFAEYYGVFILNVNQFFRKLIIYFSEENGLASKFLHELKSIKLTKIHGRILALLLNVNFESYLNELDALVDKDSKLLAAAIRANANLSRPLLNINIFGWKKFGAKHVGNKLLKCRTIEIDNNVQELLNWKRTAKIALALSKRTTYQTDIFLKFATLRPISAIKAGLKLMKLHGEKVDALIWESIKPIIQELDIAQPSREYIFKHVVNIEDVPMKIRPEYSTVVYMLLLKIHLYDAMPSLCHVEILLPEVDEQFLENFVAMFLQNDFTIENLSENTKNIICTCLYLRILIKYLLLCKDEEDQKRKLKKYFEPFLVVMEELRKCRKKELFETYFPEMLLTLKYSKVFLSTQYVSPLPLIEKIIVWMHKQFTVAEHFKTYAQIHMLMLFYKATQQAIKLVPNVFRDNKRKRTEGVEIVGKIFGKYIATEVNNLQDKYFESMPEMYINSVVTFLEKFNYYTISSDLLVSMIKGMFEKSGGSSYRLGIYLMEEKRYDILDEHFQELINCVHKIEDKQAQWFYSAFDW